MHLDLPKNLMSNVNAPFTFFLSFYSLQPVTDFLLKGLQFTHTAAKYMMAGTPVGEAFK